MRAQLLILGALLSAGLLTQPADARSRDRDERPRQEQRDDRREDRRESRREQRPEERRDERREHRGDRSAAAARRAQERNGGGRVLSVEPENAGYRVKVLKDGEVRTHHVED